MALVRLGLHRMSGRADAAFRDHVEHVRPNVVKILDPSGDDESLAAWCRARGTEVIGRIYFDPQELGAAGGRQIRKVVSAALAFPSIRYWEFHNEAWQAGDDLAAYSNMSIEFMAAIQAIGGGRRAVIGCFSVGMPDLPQWPRFAPALRYAAERGHVLGLHQYGGGSQGMRFDPAWLALRHRQVIAWAKAAGVPMPRILITEAGIDVIDQADRPTRGWKTMGNGYDYAADLAWFCRELSRDPLVIGAVDFGWATIDPQWSGFDLAGDPAMLSRVIQAQLTLPAAGPPPAPETPPAPPIRPPVKVPPLRPMPGQILGVQPRLQVQPREGWIAIARRALGREPKPAEVERIKAANAPRLDVHAGDWVLSPFHTAERLP